MQRQAAADEASAAGDQDAFNRGVHLELIGSTAAGHSRKWNLGRTASRWRDDWQPRERTAFWTATALRR